MLKPTTESSTVNKLVPPVLTSTASSSDRSRSQSPMNSSTIPTTKGSTPPPPPPTATTSSTVKQSTTDNKPTASARKTSLSDLEKELQEFDIDLDKDDVSDVENGQSTGVFKKTTVEDEVKPFK